MKRIIFFIVLVYMMLTIASACAAAEPSPASTPTTMPTSTVAPKPKQTPESASTPKPEDISNTTGQYYEGEYKPVMAVVENSPAARPQTGLQTADVVYEVPVEGSITRFVCVFSDNVPDEVMPIRSGRVTFLYLQQEWDSIIMHWGGSGDGKSNAPWYTFYGNELNAKVKIDLDGLYGKNSSHYYHRVSGKKAPHNVMGNPLVAQQQYDYSPKPLDWQFDKDAAYSGSVVTTINLAMCSKDTDFISYTYDASNDVYLRSMGGKTFKSAETGEQVKIKNIIVQYSTYESYDVYKVWQMLGKGSADFYIGGRLVKGTWSKESAESRTMFYDDKGDPIVLRPGNTWIHICPNE